MLTPKCSAYAQSVAKNGANAPSSPKETGKANALRTDSFAVCGDRWRECSIWEMFFSRSMSAYGTPPLHPQRRSSPELVSIMERLRAKSLSLKSIRRFFIFRLGLAKNWIPNSWSSLLARGCDTYPRSAKILPKRNWTNSETGFRSSIFPGVICKFSSSPLSLTRRWSLKRRAYAQIVVLRRLCLRSRLQTNLPKSFHEQLCPEKLDDEEYADYDRL